MSFHPLAKLLRLGQHAPSELECTAGRLVPPGANFRTLEVQLPATDYAQGGAR